MNNTVTKIAINGFGRIGRLFFRRAFGEKGLDIAAVNDLGDAENLAYLLKYDTVYGRYGKEVKTKPGALVVEGKAIVLLQEKDPAKLPWKKLGIDIVVEATGIFESYEKAKAHLAAGAKRVVITAPAKDLAPEPVRCGAGADGSPPAGGGRTILMGVNESEMDVCPITSNGSCTTNAASPVIQIMSEDPGIVKAILNTVHGYTATQNLVDGPTRGKDWRRGRAAGVNIVPSTTGAAIAVTRAIPELEGKFDGIALRVPVASGSVADITFVAKRKTSVEEINDIFRRAAKSPRWKGILAVTEDQVVSSDIICEPYGAIVDLSCTKVVGGDLVKILSWYDNEYGYAAMLVKHVIRAAANLIK